MIWIQDPVQAKRQSMILKKTPLRFGEEWESHPTTLSKQDPGSRSFPNGRDSSESCRVKA